MKRTILTILILVAAVAGGAFILNNNKEKMNEQVELARATNNSVPVQVAEVSQTNYTGAFTATGTFAPSREIIVVTELAGKVVRLLADEGDYVKKDQLLARIDHVTLEAELKAAEANLAKLATDKARFGRLIKTGGVTQSQLDEINLAFVNAETRVVSAKKRVQDSYIRAPFAGYVNKRFIEEGAYLNAGKEVFEIVETARVSLVVRVPERRVLDVEKSKTVKVQTDVYPGFSYDARVKFVGAKADANLNFPVELEIKNVESRPLRAGMYGRAEFGLSGTATTLSVPRAALVGSVDDARVFVVEGESVVTRDIVAGQTFGHAVEVLGGLKAGERVVVSGQINLTDGTKVTVLNQDAPTF